MKNIFPLLILALALTAVGCGDDDDGGPATTTLALRATSTYGDDPLVMFERQYDYEEGMKLQMQLLQVYLSNLVLTYEEGGQTREEPLEEIALVDFGDIFTDADAEAGIEVLTAEVPIRSYTGLKMGMGVAPELNATVPPDYDLTHPLSQNYWEDASSYIFFKIEGNADLDGSGNFEDKLTYHIGGDNNFSEVTFSGALDLTKEETKQLVLNIDLQDVLIDENGEFWDFREAQFAHSTTSPAAVFMAQNFPKALSLQIQ